MAAVAPVRALRSPAGALAAPWLPLAACLAASTLVVRDALSATTPVTLVLYLASTAYYLYRLGRPWRLRAAFQRIDVVLAGGVALLYLAGAAWFATRPGHFHFDEFITAYTSATLPAFGSIQWFAGYPDPGQWICQFPILFFALQWPFVGLLEPSVAAIRVSVWPYLALTAVYLYALAGRYTGSRAARVAAVVLFAALAPNLYLASMGVHFASAALFLLACVYHYERAAAERRADHAALCGLWLGLSFLTYTASFLALPLLVAYALIGQPVHRGPPAGAIVRPLTGFAAVLLPFAAYALGQNNYFVQRPDQVGGPFKDAATTGDLAERASNLWALVRDAALANVRTIYTPGDGGVTNYDFGHQALLDHATLALLALGGAVALSRAARSRDDAPLRPLAAVLLGFVCGMVLTLPTGAFHRLVVVFPFVALLLAMGLEGLSALVGRLDARAAAASLAVGTTLLVAANLVALDRMIRVDGPKASESIASYLMAHVRPGAHVTIAADPVFHLQRELYFRTGNRYRFTTGWFWDVSPTLDDGPVIVYAPEIGQVAEIERRFPDWAVVDTIDGQPLVKYVVVLPPA